jgi:small-conductance mechanosensitive channel
MQGMRKARPWLVVSALSVLFLVAMLALVLTRDSGLSPLPAQARRAPLVDEQPVQTASRLMTLASTRGEQRFAYRALRLADEAVDLAFAEAMREATLRPAANSTATKELFARVSRAEAQVKSDQELIEEIKRGTTPAPASEQDEIQQQFDLLQAQLELDKDELENAKSDLLRSGADPLSRIRRQFARYQAAQKEGETARSQTAAPEAIAPPDHLVSQFQAWREQGTKLILLQRARAEALEKHAELQRKRDAGELPVPAPAEAAPSAASKAAPGGSQGQAVIALLRGYSLRQKNLADLNKRMQDHQDLSDTYGDWIAAVQVRWLAAVHGMIRSGLLIVLIVLGAYLLARALDRVFTHLIVDRRRLRTVNVVLRFSLQAVGVLLIIFVLFGMPSQMPTILGLAGAGLTVALKDFIVAFFGWFALMGRNGIRVGDWVEIKGVVGEVVDIGLLRTVLLETGNWNDAGHPTGRKVAFVNSFAIEGHYFNFSTTGQWLWDELQFLVPATRNPYPLIDAIQNLVATATEASARQAEQEWQRSTHREGMRSVSAAPAINLRPTAVGVEVHVRYITRAHERYATRTKLYQEIVALLHQRESEAVSANRAVGVGT